MVDTAGLQMIELLTNTVVKVNTAHSGYEKVMVGLCCGVKQGYILSPAL